MQQVNLEVDASHRVALIQAGVDEIQDVLALQVRQTLHAAFQAQEAPDLGVLVPKAAQVQVEAGGSPVLLLDALVALQFVDQP